jgi:N-acetylglucosamine malate deacetylase 1
MKCGSQVAMAVAAHPDDIEFLMAGTMLQLGRVGVELHYMNLASGSCGSGVIPAGRLRGLRRREARASARVLGACYHPPLVDDLELYYERKTLARLAAVIREVRPTLLLVPSPQDYMEDHMNACRLVVTAAFARGMPNFVTQPRRGAVEGPVTVYHAMPHGLRGPLRCRVIPGSFVQTTPVVARQREALEQHRSQRDWLGRSQLMDRYVETLEGFALDVGRMSGRYEYAEGWRRRLHYGFCAEGSDPLADLLGADYCVNRGYEDSLERGAGSGWI